LAKPKSGQKYQSDCEEIGQLIIFSKSRISDDKNFVSKSPAFTEGKIQSARVLTKNARQISRFYQFGPDFSLEREFIQEDRGRAKEPHFTLRLGGLRRGKGNQGREGLEGWGN